VTEMLKWDGEFAAPGRGISSLGLTCDHADLEKDGTPVQRGECGASYTAASKESLHLVMLALVVNKTHLAWHWMVGAADESAAVAMAGKRLTDVLVACERFRKEYPGLIGCLPWVSEVSKGFRHEAPKQKDVMIPALDNGQLAFGMAAVATAPEHVGKKALAARYAACVKEMGKVVNTLWMRPDGERGAWAIVMDPKAPVCAGARDLRGISACSFENEIMIMSMDLYGTWSGPTDRQTMWHSVRRYTKRSKEYSDPKLPPGDFTVQEGWCFSAHKMRTYMVLPYFDQLMALCVFKNG